MNNETLKRDLCARLMDGVKVQYEGILNGKERSKAYSEWKKRNEGKYILDSDECDLPDEIVGVKNAPLRRVIQYRKHWLAEAGIKQYKKFYNGIGLKPILFPTSALTKEIQLANYNNGEPFVPVEEIGKIHLGDKYNSFDFPKEDENFIGFNSKYGGWSMYNFGDFSSLPQWIIELLNRWHINYRLSPDQFIEVTEEFNPYK